MRKLTGAILLLTTVLVSGCMGRINGGVIKSGDTVFVTYTATYEGESTVFDEELIPVAIKVGQGDLLPHIDDQLLGLSKGDKKTILVTPNNGFGEEYNPESVKILPAMYFTVGGQKVGINTVVNLDGREGTVIGVQGEGDEQLLTIDMNPQYTWKNLEYVINIQQVGGREFVPQED